MQEKVFRVVHETFSEARPFGTKQRETYPYAKKFFEIFVLEIKHNSIDTRFLYEIARRSFSIKEIISAEVSDRALLRIAEILFYNKNFKDCKVKSWFL